ncbi:hypothetical protein FS749_008157 [Ceratobasidium sp. UAMH 11750]|nr:hypothetical protein FS749_008157 [Ceratobasidium sp. UAMH 11750]
MVRLERRGYLAFRYKSKYYRNYIYSHAWPSEGGARFAHQIPRDGAERDDWIQGVISSIEEEEAWRKDQPDEACGDDDDYDGCPDRSEPYFVKDIRVYNDWIFPTQWIAWTYVIDLDNRAFTVNGVVHFNLDNMPYEPGFDAYFNGPTVLPIPNEYLTTARQWLAPTFNIDAALQLYETLQPRVIGLGEWGAPTWDTLSLAQHLAVQLVETTIVDNYTKLSVPDRSSRHFEIATICWKIACAAAPSHLLCPAVETSRSESMLYASHKIVNNECYSIIEKDKHRTYYWFRGCLVTVCIRLDEDLHVKREVGLMAKFLRNRGRTGGLGIVVSGRQMVAVSVDGLEIRHSPALDIHDASWSPGRDAEYKLTLGNGLLLLIHLLSPALTVDKTPWNLSFGSPHNSSSALPDDVIRHIVHFTDDDTYHFVLPLVSRHIRSYCLEHPRIGGYTLLAFNSDASFNVLHHATGTGSIRAKIVRKVDQRVQPALLDSFQHHQTGVGAFENVSDSVAELLKSYPYLDWRSILGGVDLPEMRIQVIDGLWSVVEVNNDGASKGG